MTKFVVFSLHRSGSSHLCDMLGRHPDVLCHYEIFHPKMQIQWKSAPGLTHVDRALRQTDADAFVERVFAESGGKRSVGFKIFRSQDPESCRKLLQRTDVHKVILERENVLARYSSHLLAYRNRVWGKSAQKPAEIDRSPLDSFDIAFFREFVRKHHKTFRSYRKRAEHPYHYLTYEQLSVEGVGDVLPFLGLTSMPIEHGFQKLHSSDIIGRFAPSLHAEILSCLRDFGKPEWVSENTGPAPRSSAQRPPWSMRIQRAGKRASNLLRPAIFAVLRRRGRRRK